MESIDITFKSSELTVDYDWQQEEKQTLNYPGCEIELQVTGIFLEGEDWISLLTTKAVKEITEETLDKIKQEHEQCQE